MKKTLRLLLAAIPFYLGALMWYIADLICDSEHWDAYP